MRWSFAIGLLVVFGLTLPYVSAAQAIDCDAVPGLAEEIRELRDVDAARGLERGEGALDDIRRAEAPCPGGEALLLRAIASNLHILGDNHEALVRIEEALSILDEIAQPDPAHVAGVLLTAGVINWELEAHDEAIRHYLQALETSEEAGDPINTARAAGNIGNLYNSLGRLQRSREYHQRALEAFDQANAATGVVGTLVNLAAVARRLGQQAEEAGDDTLARQEYERMLEAGQRALEQFESLDNPRGISYAASNVASALERLGRPEQALEYHRLGLELRRRVGDKMGEIESMLSMASTYQQLDELETAASLLEQAADQVPDDNLGRSIEIAQRRVDVETARGDFERALAHQKEVDRYRRRMAESQMAARVEEVRMAMEAEQREQELELLRTEAVISDLRLKRQRATTAVAALLAVLFLLLFGGLYGRYRLRVKTSMQLDRVSRTDPLTGLANRRDMLEHLQAAVRHCEDEDEHATVIMVDIDDFKEINDTYGHDVGDQVLIHYARVLGSRVRSQDIVARWGGEEFLILLPHTDLDGGRKVAEDLRLAMAAEAPEVDGIGRFAMTTTFGLTELRAGQDLDQCIKQADEALYAGKAQGKDRIVVFDPAASR